MNHLEMIVAGCHYDPFQYLGAHFEEEPGKVVVRTIRPGAIKVGFRHGDKIALMNKIHETGVFECVLDQAMLSDPNLNPFNYQFIITWPGGYTFSTNDPYRFPVLLGEEDRYLFNKGENYLLYNHLGAHRIMVDGINGTVFRVWAPNARSVSVIGDFSNWSKLTYQMRTLGPSGIWELFIPQMKENTVYKFLVSGRDGVDREKSDPFQFYGEVRPRTGSIIRKVDNYLWEDSEWQRKKQTCDPYKRPMSIYEVHPGSWKRDPDDPERFLTWKELADMLVPYVKERGFTHIEFMPVAEHPLDESWGYQITSPFSITSRYGIPEEFMSLVNLCHQNDIGVILDWVPAHFPTDGHSLGRFDGTALYEHDDPRKGFHPDWGTYIYNYGRNEVSNFLIANALFWLDKYHIDGLRVDAVASMLYLDYSREEGEWVPNEFGGRENLEAISFLRHLNATIYREFPNTLMIAEESTAFAGVSKPTDENGLGFGFKWNMGWMNDTLSYFSEDPLFRKYHHNEITFSIIYAFSENFILPLSHDEVVHGKHSLMDKFPGGCWEKFANQRLLFTMMWLHPGKKLIFMGGEFGQWREWNCKQSLDWHLLEENDHQRLQNFLSRLNAVYKENPAMWEKDYEGDGFRWIDLQDQDNSILSFARIADDCRDHLICLLNFTPQILSAYPLGLLENVDYEIICSSDDHCFGGAGVSKTGTVVHPVNEPWAEAPCRTTIDLGPLCGIILKPVR
ncbi:1,4-alpha-glucan branching protein GlgB [Desulforhopalus vacuolatus]|uniref:1,4-alpha-glucan branching protein GlgB n=1 Tax=Desulforhopalus vacuolatus TaxID=40414 RepID=UPI001963905B|nr:1,4-alpha-glucan branching protein GlgB [Desulforhopalus vacuolatus]MBM9519060.1 1,4-alpha-glucan branching protein GlgB [Desulforhopalus vacuolatus]